VESALTGLRASSDHVAVRGLTKRFGASTVLDAVDLSVPRGALVTLLGPSGCGKTTLLRLIAGLAAPDEGAVSIAGADVTYTPPHKRKVGFVFQSYALFPHLSVAGNVGFGLAGRGLAKDAIAARVGRALDLVQLGDLGDRPVTKLSGGQQQRVALARALTVEPDVLLFDEALSALDRNLRQTMQVELRRLLKSLGATAVFVTHDQDEALTMSDKIAVMNAGRIEHYADPQSVYARPETLFVMRFVGVSSEVSGVVTARRGTQLTVDTPIGLMVAEGDQRIGTQVVVATRPEHVKIERPNGAGTDPACNSVDGRVRQIIFQGSRTRVAVDVSGPKDFIAEIAGLSALPPVGAPVRASWPSALSFAYPDAGG
jgi:putative spermidine/putrescine transport system ATP-binding protein